LRPSMHRASVNMSGASAQTYTLIEADLGP
jgi:hypothetical protein